MVELTGEQELAINRIMDWYHGGKYTSQTFFLSGYAGTGKSTVITNIINQVIDTIPDKEIHRVSKGVITNIHVACPTGKATSVIRDNLKQASEKGELKENILVSTIHRFAFIPYTKKCTKEISKSKVKKGDDVVSESDCGTKVKIQLEDLRFRKKEPEDVEHVDLLIIDESSMLTQKMYHDIIDFDIKILFVGDIAQLPPVDKKNSQLKVLGGPDAQLTIIHRQAEGSAIRDLSEAILNGKLPQVGVYGKNREVKVMTRDVFMQNTALRRDIYMEADQVICGTNATRHYLNQEIRAVKGFSGTYPMVGEKVICLKNQDVRIGGVDLVNGLMGEVVDVDTQNMVKVHDINSNYDEHTFSLQFSPENVPNSVYQDLNVSTLPFTEERFPASLMHKRPSAFFDFGYAITGHKSQGSQWDKVLAIVEVLDKKTFLNWLYTIVTRAKVSLILVVPA